MPSMFRALSESWLLRRERRQDIGLLRVGSLAKVVGTARSEAEPLIAPLTGRRCVCFRVVTYKGPEERQILLSDVDEGQRFFVDDATGSVRIDQRGYASLILPAVTIHHRDNYAAGKHLDAYIRRHGRDKASFFEGFTLAGAGVDPLEYREQVVEVGAEVAVLGQVAETGELAAQDPRGSGYRDARALLQLEPPPTSPLLVSGKPAHRR